MGVQARWSGLFRQNFQLKIPLLTIDLSAGRLGCWKTASGTTQKTVYSFAFERILPSHLRLRIAREEGFRP